MFKTIILHKPYLLQKRLSAIFPLSGLLLGYDRFWNIQDVAEADKARAREEAEECRQQFAAAADESDQEAE